MGPSTCSLYTLASILRLYGTIYILFGICSTTKKLTTIIIANIIIIIIIKAIVVLLRRKLRQM